MSYGSISLPVMMARVRAAQYIGTMVSTGEGGYPMELEPYADHIITQVATGLFGVSEESIRRAPLLEIKYAQGAKPGLGGHLLGNKNTQTVARLRGQRIHTAVRRSAVRASPHFYNEEAEIDALVEAL